MKKGLCFYEKRAPKIPPNSILFLDVLRQNKALYNFRKREQCSIVERNISLEYDLISSYKTHEQDCISKLRNIRVNNFHNVIIGTLNINSLASKLDEFKLAISGIFDILTITETKITTRFLLPNFTLKVYQCHIWSIEIRMVVEPMSEKTFPLKS